MNQTMSSKIKLISLLLIVLAAFTCTKDKETEEEDLCIDESKINLEAPCYLIYAPVCGCNGETYSNDCQATNSGVLSFVEGECQVN